MDSTCMRNWRAWRYTVKVMLCERFRPGASSSNWKVRFYFPCYLRRVSLKDFISASKKKKSSSSYLAILGWHCAGVHCCGYCYYYASHPPRLPLNSWCWISTWQDACQICPHCSRPLRHCHAGALWLGPWCSHCSRFAWSTFCLLTYDIGRYLVNWVLREKIS